MSGNELVETEGGVVRIVNTQKIDTGLLDYPRVFAVINQNGLVWFQLILRQVGIEEWTGATFAYFCLEGALRIRNQDAIKRVLKVLRRPPDREHEVL